MAILNVTTPPDNSLSLVEAGKLTANFCARVVRSVLLLLWCCAGIALESNAQSPTPEYRIKAVFLFNFAQFVEWPAEAFADAKVPLVIGIYGRDPFGEFLDETVQNEVVQGRRIEIKRLRSLEETLNTHILFISTAETKEYEKILKHVADKPILTVGDADQFAIRGGMVRFLTESNKVRLRINIDSVRASKLTISSKLLRVAEVVGNKKE